MKMNRKWMLVAALLLSVAMATTGTLAYLQDQKADVNVMTLGSVYIKQIEQERDGKGGLTDFTDNKKPLFPVPGNPQTYINLAGEETNSYDSEYKFLAIADDNSLPKSLPNVQDKIVSVKNEGKSDAYVRTLIAFEVAESVAEVKSPGTHIGIMRNDSSNASADATKPGNSDWSWEWLSDTITVDGQKYAVAVVTHNAILPKGETTIPSLLQVYMKSNGDNEYVAKLGDTYEILVVSQAVQTAGFADAKTALNTAFNNGVALTAADTVEWFGGAIDEHKKEEASKLFDTWDGTASTDWYNDTDTEFELATTEAFAGLAELIDGGNTFEGKTIKLAGNLDLYKEDENGEPIPFDPIGSYRFDESFKGTFDGQGHTISNLSQNTWALNNGYYYNDCGLGLFGAVEDGTVKNLIIDGVHISGESALGGIVAAVAHNATFENITVRNSSIADYQYYAGGIVGWASGEVTIKNCNLEETTTVAAQWGDFDNSNGGLIGGASTSAKILLKDCKVACRIDAYNDVTSSYRWYAYRRSGMLIGNSGATKDVDGTTVADAPQLTCENVTVIYGDWANYTYCEFAGTSWPYVRVQAGVSNSAYSNPRYGHPTDANGNEVVDDNHVHNDGEDHFIECTFDQLYGGGQGVYGKATHDGVTVVYNNK